MSGALAQILATGPHDQYLTANPKVSYFKSAYRRHTNFSVESIEQGFSGAVDFGKTLTAVVARSADLMGEVFLRVVLPKVEYEGPPLETNVAKFAWVKNIGFAMIDDVDITIGTSSIDRQYGDWMDIWHQLTACSAKTEGFNRMIGNTDALTAVSSLGFGEYNNRVLKESAELFIPFSFYFCRDIALAIPLVALTEHQVQLRVKLRPVEQLCNCSETVRKNVIKKLHLVDASLLINMVRLDETERARFSTIPHEYMFEQLQYAGEETFNGSTKKLNLNFTHPVKSIYWVVKNDNYLGKRFMVYHNTDWEAAREQAARDLLMSMFDLDEYGYVRQVSRDLNGDTYQADNGVDYNIIDPADPSEEANFIFADSVVVDMFNGNIGIGRLASTSPLMVCKSYCDLKNKVEGVMRLFIDPQNNDYVQIAVEKITMNELTIQDLSIPIDNYNVDNRNDLVKNSDIYIWQHNNSGVYIDGSVNPVIEADIRLNGSSRQSKRSGTWYDTVEPYMHHSATPSPGVNMYSFALYPEKTQPSGSCNFSHINTAMLQIRVKQVEGVTGNNDRVCIYARNINVLRVMHGKAGIAFAN
jgi:hypothetical protein